MVVVPGLVDDRGSGASCYGMSIHRQRRRKYRAGLNEDRGRGVLHFTTHVMLRAIGASSHLSTWLIIGLNQLLLLMWCGVG